MVAKTAITAAGACVAAAGLVLTLNLCQPAYKMQSIAEAEKQQEKIEERIEKLVDENKAEHNDFRNSFADQNKQLRIVSDKIHQTQIMILQELRSITGAPSGPAFRRGSRTAP